MRRTLALPLVIGLLAGGLTGLIQSVLRPAAVGHPMLLWFLGPAPNVVVGLCFPFLAMAYPFESLAHTRRAINVAAALTVGVLVTFELWRPFAGARTYDPLDILGSILGALAGATLAHLFAPQVAETSGIAQPRPNEGRS